MFNPFQKNVRGVSCLVWGGVCVGCAWGVRGVCVGCLLFFGSRRGDCWFVAAVLA